MTPLDSLCRTCKNLNPATSKELIWLTTTPPRVMNPHLNRHIRKVDQAMIKKTVVQVYTFLEYCFKRETAVLERLWSSAHLKFKMRCWFSVDCFLSYKLQTLFFMYQEFEQQRMFFENSRCPSYSKLTLDLLSVTQSRIFLFLVVCVTIRS